MLRFLVLITFFLQPIYGEVMNAAPEKPVLFQDTEKLDKDIDAALANLKKKSPQVHEDSLRIWKNFKAGKADPTYTYRYWGRCIILFLQNEKAYTFDNSMKIAQVFGVLLQRNLISKDAAHVLASNVWSQLSYLQGSANPHGEQLPDAAAQKKKPTADARVA